MIGRMFLGRYEAQKLLGEGGMGKVYLAKQLDLGRPVVVKVMHDHIAADPKFRDRFQRETILMARFQHPNAVTLYDASLTDPFGPCIVMEFVKGVNLEKLLKDNGRLSHARVGRIVAQLCDALQAAHDAGMIHRDLKPANIMITDPDTPKERVKVMDFGLAKLVDDGHCQQVTDTAVDFAVGTPGYICPEQVRGEAMDHRGDLYSVGVMLYELLTSRLPFQGATSMDVLLAHATEDPPRFAELGIAGVVPAPVEEVVRWCLEKDPADRPQSARELAARYAAALTRTEPVGLGSGVRAGLPPEPPADGPGADSDPILLSASMVPPTPPPRPGLGWGAATVLASTATPPPRDPTCLPFQMEAWMPEAVAVMKLRGFVHDVGGEVLESGPGLIRVRLTKGGKPAGSGFSWFGLAARRDGPVDVELRLNRAPHDREGKLTIQVLFRPSHPTLMSDEGWLNRCQGLFVQLRGYLMGGLSHHG
jgi:serine/threonine-protein kinase